ncbi:MAG: hypothetical protein KGI71_04720, partial [Patescibacteria group bacterium]|nr:hypothetical protein [Patescibacteria group bacterium]
MLAVLVDLAAAFNAFGVRHGEAKGGVGLFDEAVHFLGVQKAFAFAVGYFFHGLADFCQGVESGSVGWYGGKNVVDFFRDWFFEMIHFRVRFATWLAVDVFDGSGGGLCLAVSYGMN